MRNRFLKEKHLTVNKRKNTLNINNMRANSNSPVPLVTGTIMQQTSNLLNQDNLNKGPKMSIYSQNKVQNMAAQLNNGID